MQFLEQALQFGQLAPRQVDHPVRELLGVLGRHLVLAHLVLQLRSVGSRHSGVKSSARLGRGLLQEGLPELLQVLLVGSHVLLRLLPHLHDFLVVRLQSDRLHRLLHALPQRLAVGFDSALRVVLEDLQFVLCLQPGSRAVQSVLFVFLSVSFLVPVVISVIVFVIDLTLSLFLLRPVLLTQRGRLLQPHGAVEQFLAQGETAVVVMRLRVEFAVEGLLQRDVQSIRVGVLRSEHNGGGVDVLLAALSAFEALPERTVVV